MIITSTNRRSFLQGAAVAAPALTIAAPAAVAARDPHRQWLKEWQRVRESWLAAEEESDLDHSLNQRMEELEELICSTPAATVEGALAQFQFALPGNLELIEFGTVWKRLDEQMFQSIERALLANA